MNVALIHYRAGLMDGVSLEMEKWKTVLINLGHSVHIIAGNSEKGVDVCIPEIGFDNPEYSIIYHNCFEKLEDYDESSIGDYILTYAAIIYKQLIKSLRPYEVIIVNNIWSLGLNLPAAMALSEYAKEHPQKLFIAHHHDFWWEREHMKCTCSEVEKFLTEYCPPTGKNIKHIVINSFAKDSLLQRKSVEAVIIPNVRDFSGEEYLNESLREELRSKHNISPGDIVLLQATRITRRKAIELAIDLCCQLKKTAQSYVGKVLYNGNIFTGRILLALSGMCEDISYKRQLFKKAKQTGVELLDLYTTDSENKEQSFMEFYNIADIVTYPSILEGWGNQLLEAILMKKPIVLFEYEVFSKDIKSSGIQYVTLGNHYELTDGFVTIGADTLEQAAKKVLRLLFNKRLYSDTVNRNFKIASQHYDLHNLANMIKQLL